MLLLLSSICAGLCLCGIVWVTIRPVAQSPFGAGAHGSHALMHLLWPWVAVLQPWCEPLVSWRMRTAIHRAVQQAGLPPVWRPGHVLALQVLAFLASVPVVLLVLAVLTDLPGLQRLVWALMAAGAFAVLPRRQLALLGRRRRQDMLRELPFLLDMTTLCVEAGLNLQAALQQAVRHGPPGPLRDELQRVLDEIRTGMPRTQALARMAQRVGLEAVAHLVAALVHAEQTGSSLAPLLRAQSDQRRAERFLRAEELALKAPVKMLFPLVSCIFPCTFLVIGFPIAFQILQDVT